MYTFPMTIASLYLPGALNSTKACRNSRREPRATPCSKGERKRSKTLGKMPAFTPPAWKADF